MTDVRETARRRLERMRESPAAWSDLRYESATDADGHAYDGNAVARAQVLWALQYDRRPGDLPLLRWLAEQEARCRREAPFQGLSEEAELAGFLLARHRQVEDVRRQWRIKLANFDTWCGYDLEHLFAAGVERTLAAVREGEGGEGGANGESGEENGRDDLLDLLLDRDGQPRVTEEGLAEWFRNKAARFPVDPAAEHPLTWVARAKLAGEPAESRRWLDRWAAGRDRDKETLGRLAHELADLGDFAEAARARRDCLVFADGPWDRASAWRDLARTERLAGDHDAAWEALRECRRALDGVSEWQEVGLGRMYVEELFALAGAAHDALAATVFAEADRQAREVPRLSLVLLRAATTAAERVGDRGGAERYRELAEAEQRRIDEEWADFD